MIMTIWNFHRYLDMFLTDILDICVTFFFVQLFLHQFEICVALLLLCWLALFFRNIGVGHIASFIHKRLTPFHNFALIPRHCDRVALDLRDLFTFFPHIRLEAGCLTLLKVASLSSLSFFVVPRSVKIVKVFEISCFYIQISFLSPVPCVVLRRMEFVELGTTKLVVVLNRKMVLVAFSKSRAPALTPRFLCLRYERAEGLQQFLPLTCLFTFWFHPAPSDGASKGGLEENQTEP